MNEDISELERSAYERAKEAVSLDQVGSRLEAASKYRQAIEIMNKLISMTANQKLKQAYAEKVEQYKKRVEALEGYKVKDHGTDSCYILEERPNIGWNDIVNLEDAKRAIKETIVYPVKRPDLFPLGWSKGILLFGPPGCGKTLIAAAVANEIDATFFYVDAASIMSKWLGESEKNVSKLFSQARQISASGRPAIIFIDEIDSLTSKKIVEMGGEARVRNQLLKEMDSLVDKGKKTYLYVIAATNKPWVLDDAFIRRFHKRIYVPLPDKKTRLELFQLYTKGMNLDPSVNLASLAMLTENYSASDIQDLCVSVQNSVASEFIEDGQGSAPRPVMMEDFLEAIRKRKPSVTNEILKKTQTWMVKHGAL